MPDSDRFILGVGATLRPNQRMAIDIGYQHVFMQDADLGMTIYDDGDAYISMTGVSSSSADLMGLQVSYQFS